MASPLGPGLQMTPSVALRALFEQLVRFEQAHNAGDDVDVIEHFEGPILPPQSHLRRPIGDPVFEAIAEYASFVISRAGMLTNKDDADPDLRLQEHGRITRSLFAIEHALAIDLARIAPEIPLRRRQAHARATLAVAAFWCDRPELIRNDGPPANVLLGLRPEDPAGAILWDHAMLALASGAPQVIEVDGVGEPDELIDLTDGAAAQVNSAA